MTNNPKSSSPWSVQSKTVTCSLSYAQRTLSIWETDNTTGSVCVRHKRYDVDDGKNALRSREGNILWQFMNGSRRGVRIRINHQQLATTPQPPPLPLSPSAKQLFNSRHFLKPIFQKSDSGDTKGGLRE